MIYGVTKEYNDLSKNPVFKISIIGLRNITSLACATEKNCSLHIHDPRRINQFFVLGEKLAKKRAQILTQIIRGDPQEALRLAVDEEKLNNLPLSGTAYGTMGL